jgi:Zn ribbon nucleic-acid-binding protein
MTARQELHALVRRLTDAESERALDLLTRWWAGPRCPSCAEDGLDQLVWQNDEQGEYVTCHSCGFCWNPNHGRALDR